MNILVIAAHSDDETLGVGGTVRKFVDEGHSVHCCIVTDAYYPKWDKEYLEQKEHDIDKAGKILGFTSVVRLGFPAAALDKVPRAELNAKILNIVKAVRPDLVFIPHRGDLHFDHGLVHDACLVALRPLEYVPTILCYEVLSETEWGTERFVPVVYLDISKTLKVKLEAMKAYSGELKEYPHPRSIGGLVSLARLRGSEVCLPAAEAFEVVRMLLPEVWVK